MAERVGNVEHCQGFGEIVRCGYAGPKGQNALATEYRPDSPVNHMTASMHLHEPVWPSELSDPVRRALQPADSPAQAEEITAHLAHTHYENFSVVSRLLPKHLRQDFANVYAFCRIADDLGDEVHDTKIALEQLQHFREHLHACYRGEASTAVFTALSQTISRHDIPIQPFDDLISAFEQDQRVRRYETFDELLDYCRRSANPVGRIVLYMCGHRDEQRQLLSDQTCTALQLANFWQDVRRDLLDLDRIYIPAESMRKFDVSETQLRELRCDDRFRALLRFEVDRTQLLLSRGEGLLDLLDASVRRQISLFSAGGMAILQAIRRQNYDTLSHRPSLSSLQKFRLIAEALLAKKPRRRRA
jgi:squalene synthase HpnC